jgi:hypothetical protein
MNEEERMRRIKIDGDKKKIVEQLEEALENVKNDEEGYFTANFGVGGQPKCEIEFAGADPSEDPEGDWSELSVEYQEVPD